MPHEAVVFGDGAVGGEHAGLGGIDNSHFQPLIPVGVILHHAAMHAHIFVQILQNEIGVGHAAAVAEEQRVVKFGEDTGAFGAQGAVDELLHHLANGRLGFVNFAGVIGRSNFPGRPR